MAHHGPTVLHLNLTDQSFEVRTHEDLSPLIGGLGWALALFEENLKEESIVFAIGPLSGIFPGCSKTIVVFRSPQSGFLTTALGGGHLARILRSAGYQALVIKGVAEKPTIISLDEEQATFKEGSHLVNKGVPETFNLIFAIEGVPGRRSILATGLAAEKGITFCPLYVDEFFSFARGGLGTAFSQKNLKGLVISGSESEDLDDIRRYEEIFYSLLTKVQGFEELGLLGTLRNLAVEKKISGVPFENLNEPNFEDQQQLVKAFADSSRLSCGGCPLGCIHLVLHEGYYIPYDYESIVALGPLLGLTAKSNIVQLLAKTYQAGLDPTSLGTILAYLIEKEKLSFGSVDTYLTLVDALLVGKEDWVRALSKGLENGIKQLGGGEFALTLAGLEALPYFNGYTTILSQVLSFSATTEENRGYLLDLDLLRGELEPRSMVAALVEGEKKKILSELLIGCGYLSPIFEEISVGFSALEALGVGVSHEELDRGVGEVFNRKIALQRKLGFDPRSVKIPRKIYSVPSPQGILKERSLKEMVRIYCDDYFQPATKK